MVLDVDQVAGIGFEAVAGVEFGQGVADEQLEIGAAGQDPPSYTALLVKMVAAALCRQPHMNVSYEDGRLRYAGKVGTGFNEELLRSLAEFYASGLSLAAAARNLFVHRHTLEYRLNRIEALLGADPKSQPTRLFLELALALRG